MSDEEMVVTNKSEEPEPRRRPKKIVIPRRAASVIVPGRKIVFITPDKTTCAECTCFPKEDPYVKPKKLNPCQHSPRSLYELAAEVVDGIKFPEAFGWSQEDVADWMERGVGLPQYRECILDNHIDGMRLLMLEDPSKLPKINIHYFEHILMITSKIREEYSIDFIRFLRSVGLPPRIPLTHCTWFKSRTGPSWGIRKNWTRCDILRWMKTIMPEPQYINHWDLVWYQKPDFPKVMFARVDRWSKPRPGEYIPIYKPLKDTCPEYLVPRKFRFMTGIPEEAQVIWMERRRQEIAFEEEEKKKQKRERQKMAFTFAIREDSGLLPRKVTTEGLSGKDLVLARRKMAKPKFLP